MISDNCFTNKRGNQPNWEGEILTKIKSNFSGIFQNYWNIKSHEISCSLKSLKRLKLHVFSVAVRAVILLASLNSPVTVLRVWREYRHNQRAEESSHSWYLVSKSFSFLVLNQTPQLAHPVVQSISVHASLFQTKKKTIYLYLTSLSHSEALGYKNFIQWKVIQICFIDF